MTVLTTNSSPITVREPHTSAAVTSRDGATIGYHQLGAGPGVVLVQGTMGTAQHFMQLAGALADGFTVIVPDRRGRGMSSAGSGSYCVQKEVEDLDALLAKTGAHNVFGLSSGALIALQAALTLPSIRRVALYEPPLFVNGAPIALMARYEQEMARGDVAAALVTAMQAAQMGPPIFNMLPRRLLEWFVRMGMKSEGKRRSGDYATMKELAPTLHNDFQLVSELSGALENFRGVNTETLLLGGSKSPAYLKVALDALEKTLPCVKRVELRGLGHAAPWNSDRGGQPERVAQELRRFFV